MAGFRVPVVAIGRGALTGTAGGCGQP